MPDRPESRLLTAARRRLIDAHRRREAARAAMPSVARPIEERWQQDDRAPSPIPDDRLRLMSARDDDGAFVPLERQDAALWSWPLIEEAEGHLARALAARRIGRYQLQAAIRAVRNGRGVTGRPTGRPSPGCTTAVAEHLRRTFGVDPEWGGGGAVRGRSRRAHTR